MVLHHNHVLACKRSELGPLNKIKVSLNSSQESPSPETTCLADTAKKGLLNKHRLDSVIHLFLKATTKPKQFYPGKNLQDTHSATVD